MATKAKTTTKKTRTAQATKTTAKAVTAPKVTRSTAPKTTSAAATSGGGLASWLAKGDPVFTPKTALGALLAELIGTFVLASVFLTGQGNLLFILFGMIGITYGTWRLSGAHLNPAISVAAWVTQRTGLLRTVGYIVAQVLGAMLAMVVANALLP